MAFYSVLVITQYIFYFIPVLKIGVAYITKHLTPAQRKKIIQITKQEIKS